MEYKLENLPPEILNQIFNYNPEVFRSSRNINRYFREITEHDFPSHRWDGNQKNYFNKLFLNSN